ncbi:MAG TPA: Ig-like domain-containing protein, partial [Candidatus Dormibacteraeota bacterium]
MSPEDFATDLELAAIFPDEPEMLELAQLVQAARPQAPVRPHFQGQLRARLMEAAPQALRPRGILGLRLRPAWLMGGALATLGAAAAITVFSVLHSGGDTVVQNLHPVASIPAGAVNVSPDQAITIAFNQPMDQASVVRAVHITPATAYTTSWTGNTLTISPTHHLAGSAAYVVSVDNRTAQATSGARLAAPVVIPFGTKPTPTPAPTPTAAPALSEAVLGQALAGSALVAAPNGDVVVGSGLAVSTAAATPSATSTASPSPSATAPPAATAPSASPGAGGSPSPAGSASPAAQPQLVRLGGGSATILGPQSAAVAISPAGHSVASLTPDGDHADVVVANLDGSNRRVLARSADATSPLAWTRAGIMFVGSGRVRLVDLGGVLHTPPLPAVTPGGAPLLVRDGNRMVLLSEPAAAAPTSPTPGAGPSPAATTATALVAPTIADLGDGSTLNLPAGAAAVAASSDGSTVAWVTQGPTGFVVQRATIPAALTGATLRPVTVDLGGGVRDVKALALSPTGATLAAAVIQSDGTSRLRIVGTPGHVLGTGRALDGPVFVSPDAVAGLAANGGASDVVVETVSGAGGGAAADPNAVPAGASTLLDNLIAAQSPAGSSALAALPTIGTPAPDVAALTPHGITQAYAVSATTGDGGASVVALVRLLHIPDASENSGTVTVADETVTLRRTTGGDYAIAGLAVTPLAPQLNGP